MGTFRTNNLMTNWMTESVKLKVFWSVIMFYAVYVMYNLMALKVPSYLLFHNKTMFSYVVGLLTVWMGIVLYVHVSRHKSSTTFPHFVISTPLIFRQRWASRNFKNLKPFVNSATATATHFSKFIKRCVGIVLYKPISVTVQHITSAVDSTSLRISSFNHGLPPIHGVIVAHLNRIVKKVNRIVDFQSTELTTTHSRVTQLMTLSQLLHRITRSSHAGIGRI